jgi:hypothetical protein
VPYDRANSLRCTAVSPGKETCRRCRVSDHTMRMCTNESRCAICIKDDVTGSLTYPTIRRKINEVNRGRVVTKNKNYLQTQWCDKL